MVKGETYEQYKNRKGITNVHQASVVLILDGIKIMSKINNVIKNKQQ